MLPSWRAASCAYARSSAQVWHSSGALCLKIQIQWIYMEKIDFRICANNRTMYIKCESSKWWARTFIHSYMHSFIHAFIHSFIYSFTHLLIYSFIHSFVQNVFACVQCSACRNGRDGAGVREVGVREAGGGRREAGVDAAGSERGVRGSEVPTTD